MELGIIMIILTIFSVVFVKFLHDKQLKVLKEIKIGDKIIYHGCDGEVVDKTQDGKFVIKIVTSGMMLSKK